ncbi:hypothetical protein KSS87_015196 [Heliosperma pusillum]|nr:hypothetical protein KSS87_015196 [Heliosperma pusillum]
MVDSHYPNSCMYIHIYTTPYINPYTRNGFPKMIRIHYPPFILKICVGALSEPIKCLCDFLPFLTQVHKIPKTVYYGL